MRRLFWLWLDLVKKTKALQSPVVVLFSLFCAGTLLGCFPLIRSVMSGLTRLIFQIFVF